MFEKKSKKVDVPTLTKKTITVPTLLGVKSMLADSGDSVKHSVQDSANLSGRAARRAAKAASKAAKGSALVAAASSAPKVAAGAAKTGAAVAAAKAAPAVGAATAKVGTLGAAGAALAKGLRHDDSDDSRDQDERRDGAGQDGVEGRHAADESSKVIDDLKPKVAQALAALLATGTASGIGEQSSDRGNEAVRALRERATSRSEVAQPEKKKGGFFGKLLTSLGLLTIAAGLAAYLKNRTAQTEDPWSQPLAVPATKPVTNPVTTTGPTPSTVGASSVSSTSTTSSTVTAPLATGAASSVSTGSEPRDTDVPVSDLADTPAADVEEVGVVDLSADGMPDPTHTTRTVSDRVDAEGHRLDESGNRLDENGHRVDDNGQRINPDSGRI